MNDVKYPINSSEVFTSEELDKIISVGEKVGLFSAKVEIKGKEVVAPKKRDTQISWIQPTKENLWIFSKASKTLSTEPISTLQAFQYSVYYVGGHYGWHRDIGKEGQVISNRIIAGTLQLSDPGDYQGGILKIKSPDKIITEVEKERGRVTVFPAGWQHTVTPVTKGVRKTLVMWGLK